MTEARAGAGEIRCGVVYSVREFCRRTGISRHRVRIHGIKTRIVAGKAFVLGDEFVALVRETRERFADSEPVAAE